MNEPYIIDTAVVATTFDGLTIKKIFNHQAEVLLISLEKGSTFPEHQSPRNALLQMLEGEIVFHMDHKALNMKGLEGFQIPSKETHSVYAVQNSKFLIIR
ncbi:MAG TPA: hypothetical protein PKW08_09575 [Flavobacteriaceae bacterium]|nr:hypothetical protein [Flavobacteriaceae bacterium]MCB9214061.1 hypothetical protein [Alteromonas sp.]HPF11605.1 hypothetical protein [Flavobacteriaceae bacterium]HQU21823.1 hypothetical protein [Flavobacteriaceae bacterium]HQU65290.1 hypothetical protein [Flavobacteriaceae bacterium]